MLPETRGASVSILNREMLSEYFTEPRAITPVTVCRQESLRPETESEPPKLPTINPMPVILSVADLGQMLLLQNKAFIKLEEEEQAEFLYKRTREEFESIIGSRDSFVIGYKTEEGKIVAQLIIKRLTPEEQARGKDYHISEAQKLQLGINSGTICFSVGGMIVDPDYRGQGLAKKLIEGAEGYLRSLEHIGSSDKIVMLSISSTRNKSSYLSFLNCGFFIMSRFVSEEDHDTDYLLLKPLSFNLIKLPTEYTALSRDIESLSNSLEDPRYCIFRENKSKGFYVANLSSLVIRSGETVVQLTH